MIPRHLSTFTDNSHEDGLTRSARLLRAIGPNAASVWARLSPADSAALREAIDALPEDQLANAKAAQALLDQANNHASLPIWQKLSSLPTAQIFALIQAEHPQMIALTLTRLSPKAAANLISFMPTPLAETVLHLVLRTRRPHPAAIAAIEELFESTLGFDGDTAPLKGDAILARIFDILDTDKSSALLKVLAARDETASSRIRELMFTFEDLANLPPAGLQTLLSKTDRATLTLALKSAQASVAGAIFQNMTARAKTVLVEEISALGPVRRADVEAARTDMIVLARHLIETGDIVLENTDGDLLADDDMIA